MISFQGQPGAYSDLACRTAYPGTATLPCQTFEAAIEAVRNGVADLAMLACENSIAGRVPDLHALLPGSGLFIVAEHFQPVAHCLLGVPGATVADIQRIHSHSVALGQVRHIVRELGAQAVVEVDTAGSAELVARWGRKEEAAVASELAAEIYGLQVLRRHVEDMENNTTRFYVMAREPHHPENGRGMDGVGRLMTTFIFHVRNVPAALYKVMGGFATNGVNMTKLESYMTGGRFTATQFLCDIEGGQDEVPVQRAFEEARFFTDNFLVLGSYPARR